MTKTALHSVFMAKAAAAAIPMSTLGGIIQKSSKKSGRNVQESSKKFGMQF